jgi:hypothetical protein
MEEIPRELIIVGGGVIGLSRFAQNHSVFRSSAASEAYAIDTHLTRP